MKKRLGVYKRKTHLELHIKQRDGKYYVRACKPGLCIDREDHKGCVPERLIKESSPQDTWEDAEKFINSVAPTLREQGWKVKLPPLRN